LLAAFAGLIFLGRLGVGEPAAGQLFELKAIAAVVIGGTPFSGGTGGVWSNFYWTISDTPPAGAGGLLLTTSEKQA